MRAFQLAVVLSLATACASTSGVGSGRVYKRGKVDSVRLKTIDVVVTAGAVQTSGPQLNVATFDVPGFDEPLLPPAEDVATRDELVASLRAKLKGRGFEPRFYFAGAGDRSPEDAPGGALVAPLPDGLGATSTTSVDPVPGAPRLARSDGALDRHLEPGTRLADVFQASDADGVLVVRVVPVDAFYIFEETQRANVVDPVTGDIRVLADDAPTPRSGRLLFGQAFLFDRATRLRLWSKNLAEFPESNRLTPKAPFLDYGVVTEVGKPELPPDRRAGVAAARFVEATFGDFLSPSEGTEAGRAMLAAVDVEAEAAEQAFLDEGWLGLGVDVGWAAESAGTSVVFEASDTVPGRTIDLGTGAIAPSGVFRVTPRLDVVSPGGFSFEIGVPIGFAPGSFARTYHFDNANAGVTDTDRGARATIDGPTLAGLEVSAGYVIPMSGTVKLLPTFGVFGEAWFLETSPAIGDDVHVRLGLKGQLDAIVRMSPSSPLFFRGGGGLRLGLDTAGPAVLGAVVNLGLGVLL